MTKILSSFLLAGFLSVGFSAQADLAQAQEEIDCEAQCAATPEIPDCVQSCKEGTTVKGTIPSEHYLFDENPYENIDTNPNPVVPDEDTISTEESALGLIIRIINFLLQFLGILALLVLVWAGYLWITAFGNDAQMEKSKKMILYTVIGIIVILMSYAIVETVLCRLSDDSGACQLGFFSF